MAIKIPFFRPEIPIDHAEKVLDALKLPWLTRGPICREFEMSFAKYVGAKYAISTSSSSMALLGSLLALNVGPGDIVIVPSLTFTACAEAVLLAGATPLLVDCDPTTLTTTLEHVLEALDWARRVHPNYVVRVAMPVHYGGNVAESFADAEALRRLGVSVLHDASHCVPSEFTAPGALNAQRIGVLNDIVCYSFYANKCITTCEGGMITTNDSNLAKRLALATNHGILFGDTSLVNNNRFDYDVSLLGVKAVLPDPLAALGLMQLSNADGFWTRRKAIARAYWRSLSSCDLISVPDYPRMTGSSWHLFPIRLNLDKLRGDRSEALRELAVQGISCSYHWKPLHLHSMYRRMIQSGRVLVRPLTNTDSEWGRLVSLPIYPGLTEEETEFVARGVIRACSALASGDSATRLPRTAGTSSLDRF